MKATFKVKVIADPTPPPPPFVGTRITVNVTGSLAFTLCGLTLAASSESVTIDWGDGAVETFASRAVCTHAYSVPGRYIIGISDDVAALTVQGAQGAADKGAVLGLRSNALTLTEIGANAFSGCANLASLDVDAAPIASIGYGAFNGCVALPPRLDLHAVSALTSRGGLVPFTGCTSVREIHFAAANEAAVKSSPAYAYDPTLGTGNADVCVFDP